MTKPRTYIQGLTTGLLAAGIWLILVGCSAKAAAPPSAAERLQKIPVGDVAKYPVVHETKNWRNPYLVIRPDGVGMVTIITPNEERIIKPEELLDQLAELPPTAWPYGRVVAMIVQDESTATQQDQIAIRRNRGIAAGELEGAHVTVEWDTAKGS